MQTSALLFLFAALFASFQARADTTATTKSFAIGFGLAMPAVGVSLKSVLISGADMDRSVTEIQG